MKSINSPSLTAFLKRDRSGRFWGYVALGSFGFSLLLCWRMAMAFETRPRFVVMDPSGTLIITREKGFEDASQIHVSQAELAVQTLLNRQPTGFDSEERLKRLFDTKSYAKALELEANESAEFVVKSIHQKAEIEDIKLQKLTGTAVESVVRGQLIRIGSFEDKPSIEVLHFELNMRFEHNPKLLENGRFPTVVRSFELTTSSIP
ncbi:hypothetical protein JIN85_18505 [Luteolibacter pohnpeiensis]|uniref:Uncharacterized protein n=1 Tax=Luteolibacter pohnpeiensis TaxID=454153 RepID=A0A934SAJ1_9BACT|nr:hypothetical protein [Luteolibacter pohnpeiensis]MBK1884415.1 hypothetical protein [Luteolibacter pohnpeiensis]